MLNLKPSYVANDVVTLKLVTGEEIIGKLIEDKSDALKLTRPLVFTVNPQNGQAMLIPWLMSVDPKDTTPIDVYKNNVVMVTKTVKQISDNYLQATSGIVAAPAGLVL